MKEQEWLACHDPYEMLALVESGSRRKLRFLACATCRRVWSEIRDERCRNELRAAEQYAEGVISRNALDLASAAARDAYAEVLASGRSSIVALYLAVASTAEDIETWNLSLIFQAIADVSPFGSNEPAAQAGLIREIFGNPFRPIICNSEWRTSDVMLLANGIYAANAFDRMPILADALQDAGCDSDAILNHLRGANETHVRGCWVLDLVLGKE